MTAAAATEGLQDAGRVGLEDGCGEPRTLSEMIAAEAERRARAHGPGLELVCGLVVAEPPWLAAVDAGELVCTTTMPGRGLSRSARVHEVQLGYPDVARAWTRGVLRADVACVSVTESGTLGLTWGTTNEMVEGVLARGGRIIAERNAALPEVRGAPAVELAGAKVIDTDRPPVELASRSPNEAERTVASNIVALLPDRACLSTGIGSMGDAVLAELVARGRRGISFHSGMLGDGHAHVSDSAIVAPSTPLGDPPFTGSTLLGSRRLFAWAQEDERVLLRSTTHIHPPGVTSRIERFCAVNFALEVDLAGNVGAETVRGRTVSGSGGQLDLASGACAAPEGKSIVALASTAPDGSSRIVPSLTGCTTTPSPRVQFVVTEHGVAEIWGRSAEERAEQLAAVAAPEHRKALLDAAYA